MMETARRQREHLPVPVEITGARAASTVECTFLLFWFWFLTCGHPVRAVDARRMQPIALQLGVKLRDNPCLQLWLLKAYLCSKNEESLPLRRSE